MFYERVEDELHHEEEETNEYALQRQKIVEANEEIFRNLGLPGTLNGDSTNKVLLFYFRSQVSMLQSYFYVP
jgi:hypothetical protein